MNEIVSGPVEDYLYGLLPQREPVLVEMEEQARQRNIPIVGPAVGRLLYQYAQLIGAKRIFELGSAIGYSTLWLARAAGPGARVYYTDGNPKNAEEARGYFERAGLADRIHVLVGDALTLLDQTEGECDLIFNDVDKQGYPEVFRRAVPRLRRGGLFITDNVLWKGRVSTPGVPTETRRSGREPNQPDAATRAIQEFNRLIYSASDLFTTILPLRDGVAVCRKL